jgi:acetyl esterase/lipase
MSGKIEAAGGWSKLEIYEGLFHCWQMANGFLPEADKALKNAAEFIGKFT